MAALSVGYGGDGVGASADLGKDYAPSYQTSVVWHTQAGGSMSSATSWPVAQTAAEASPNTWAEAATPSSVWQSTWTTSTTTWASPTPTTWSTTSSCTGPIESIYQADEYSYSPKSGVPPLATHYIKTISGGWGSSATTTTSIYCNTSVFEKYFRPSIFNCNCGVGPFQTLDASCNIVVGPIFTRGCSNSGYFVTQTGPSGFAIDLTAVATTSCGTVSTSTLPGTGIVVTNAPTSTSTPMLRKRATVSVSGTVANVNTLTSAQGALTVTS